MKPQTSLENSQKMLGIATRKKAGEIDVPFSTRYIANQERAANVLTEIIQRGSSRAARRYQAALVTRSGWRDIPG